MSRASSRGKASGAGSAQMRVARARRAFRVRVVLSAMLHVGVIAGLAIAPRAEPRPLPPVVRVNLVAPARLPAPAAAKAPAPAPAAPPVAKPVPRKIVLPEQPAPAKPKPKPVPKRVRKPEARPPAASEPLDYDDALAALRAELGEQTPAPATEANSDRNSEGSSNRLPSEVEAWMAATQRDVKAEWITLAEWLNRDLVTLVRVRIAADGTVQGRPQVLQSSGDPSWDDNTVRAIERASPLPPPPEPGNWEFNFSPREDS